MSLKSNTDSSVNASGLTYCLTGTSGNPDSSELMMVCDLDLDFDDCYLLGLPKLTGNIFEEMRMLEDSDLEFEDLFLFGGLSSFKDANDDESGNKDSGNKEGTEMQM